MTERVEKSADALGPGDVVAIGGGVARVIGTRWSRDCHLTVVLDNGDRLRFVSAADAAADVVCVVVPEAAARGAGVDEAAVRRNGTEAFPNSRVARAHARAGADKVLARMTPAEKWRLFIAHSEDRKGGLVWTPVGVPRPQWAKTRPRPGRFYHGG